MGNTKVDTDVDRLVHAALSEPAALKQKFTVAEPVEFYGESGHDFLIQTSCNDASDFLNESATALARLLEGRWMGDAEYKLQHVLPLIFEIACSLQGYKSEARKQTLTTAGSISPLQGRVYPGETEAS